MITTNHHLPSRKTEWLLLLIATAVALAIVIAPVWIIQPFKPQSGRGVEISYLLRRWSPWVTLVLLALALVLIAKVWRGARWWKKILLAILLIPLLASTWFARQNHFEWMFNPLAGATFAKISDAGFISDEEVVLAVENHGEAVAYPVRLMAYHHLVQDVVGGTPIVATY